MRVVHLSWFAVALSLSCAETNSGPPAGGTAGPPAASSAPLAASTPSTPSTPPAGPIFECQLRMEPRVVRGKPAVLHFKLTQRSSGPLYVLKWRTPLEGLRGDDYLVSRDGTEIPYVGPMFKRGDPPAKDYLEMQPGVPLEAEVELSNAYDFEKVGHYRVSFRGRLWDVVTSQSEVPRPLDRHQAVPLSCNSLELDVAAQ
jgi:peptidyl-Lys metalloendopeptidase